MTIICQKRKKQNLMICMANQKRIIITGAAGFIGHHLCKRLKEQGHWVRGVDWKDPEYGLECDEFMKLDLRSRFSCIDAFHGVFDEAWLLAADMGGMGFIQDPKNQPIILYNNTMIDFNSLEECRLSGIKKVLYSSSACIYPNYKQTKTDIAGLKESDAYPADPQDTYGWEKIMMEQLCESYRNYGIDIKVVRFHNVYGPEGTYKGGREKAPAALCRKVITAIRNEENFIEIWGDGEQTRSFCHIDDCLKALELVMNSDVSEPINIGRDDMLSINKLAEIIQDIAGTSLIVRNITGPLGVRGRNSDNTMFKEKFNWQPEISMKSGLTKTYNWIKGEIDNE